MKIDRKIRERIIEILAISALADEERLLGIPQTAATMETLRERAIARYVGAVWSPVISVKPFEDCAFHARVRHTAAALFQAIEQDEESEDEIAARELLNRTVFVPYCKNPSKYGSDLPPVGTRS